MSIVPVPHCILSFRDALGVALELGDEFAYAQAVATIDRSGQCIDFRVFTKLTEGLSDILGWLSTRRGFYPSGSQILLFSVRSIDVAVIAERDLADFRFARHAIEGIGAALVDWIETDGELVRSYAFLTTPNTDWANQALAEGALDRGHGDWQPRGNEGRGPEHPRL